jgi:hypothetical protein
MKHLAYLVGLVALAFAPSANADLVVWYQIDNGAVVNCATGPDTGPVSCTFSGLGATVALVGATSNSPGGATAEQFSSETQVSSTLAADVKIFISAENFITPQGGTYESSLDTTATLENTTSTANLKSCIDLLNGNADGSLGCLGGMLTNTGETITGAGSQSNTVTTSVSNMGAPYALQQLIDFTLTPGSSFNVITSQSILASPVPEPTSMLLLGTVLVGLTSLFRKKRSKK